MNNDVLAEAILCVASAIHCITANARSCELADRAKGFIGTARLQDQLDAMKLELKRSEEAEAAKAAARRQADAAAVAAVAKPAIPAITAAMNALAGRALQMRDDQLNVLMFEALMKLNTEDIKEWLDADALIRGVSPIAAESRR